MMRSFWTAVLAALFLSAPAFAKGEAVVLSAAGDVQYRETASGDWQALGGRASLKEGEFILTGPGSSCELGFLEGSKSVVRIGPDSLVRLDSANPAKIDLQNGRLFSLVRNLKKGTAFSISSPTAVASVRGTGWEQGTDHVTVFNDTVHVDGAAGQSTDVTEGNGIRLSENGRLGETYEASSEALEEWKSFEESASRELGEHLDKILTDIEENDPNEDLFTQKEAFQETAEQTRLDDSMKEISQDDFDQQQQTG